MDTQEKQPGRSFARRYLTIILLFAISVVGIFILFRTYPYPGGLPSSLYLWVYLFLVVILTLMMAKTVLADLLHRGRLKGILMNIAERGLVRGIATPLLIHPKKARGPGRFLGFLGAVILLIVLLLWRYEVLFEQNMKLVRLVEYFHPRTPVTASRVRILHTFTAGRSAEDRLRWLLKATEDLKNAGARIVVVKLPSTLFRPRCTALVDKISATGVAVLGVNLWFSETNWRTKEYIGGKPHEGTYEDAGLLTAAPLSYAGDVTVEPPLGCFVPFAYRHDFYSTDRITTRDTSADVALEVIRKWNGYPKSLRPRVEGRHLLFGDYRIPVTTAGLAVVHRSEEAWLSATGGDDFESDSVGYRGRYASEPGLDRDLSRFAEEIRGKVIILANTDEGDLPTMGYYRTTATLAWTIEGVLEQDFLAFRDDLVVWLILAVSALSLLIVLRLKPLPAFISLLLLGVLFAAGAAWLYLGTATLIQAVYPLLVIALGMTVLPAARLVREIRLEGGT
jgi:hypothetical protein